MKIQVLKLAAFAALLFFATQARSAAVNDCLMRNIEGVINPWDLEYDTARRTRSKFYSNYPIAIVNAESVDDIVAALACARASNVSTTARGGGHGNAGQSSMNGAVMIDLRNMNSVQVSDDWDTVTVQAGATAGRAVYEVSQQTNFTRNLPVGQKPTVGMAGLTLGGGWGFFSRYQGLLCDQVISLTMVLPDGQLVTANATENADIFWASCGGGGGNVGIATEFKMRTMKVPEVATMIDFDSEAYTVEAVEFYQDLSLKLSDRVTLNLEVTSAVSGDILDSDVADYPKSSHLQPARPGQVYLQFVGVYLGFPEDLLAELEQAGMSEDTLIRLSDFARHATKVVPVWEAQLQLMGWNNDGTMEALIADYASEDTYYQYKSMFLFEKLPPAGIQILLNAATWNTDGSSLVWEFQALGGGVNDSAVARVSPSDTAFSHRNARHGLLLKSNAREPGVAVSLYGRMVQAWVDILPYIEGGASYVNMIDLDLGQKYAEAYYGIYPPGVANGNANVDRLRSITGSTNPNGMLATVQPVT